MLGELGKHLHVLGDILEKAQVKSSQNGGCVPGQRLGELLLAARSNVGVSSPLPPTIARLEFNSDLCEPETESTEPSARKLNIEDVPLPERCNSVRPPTADAPEMRRLGAWASDVSDEDSDTDSRELPKSRKTSGDKTEDSLLVGLGRLSPTWKHGDSSEDADLRISSRGSDEPSPTLRRLSTNCSTWSTEPADDEWKITRDAKQSMANKIDDLLKNVHAVNDPHVEVQYQDVLSAQGFARKLVSKSWFEGSIAALIVLNAVVMGIQADHKMRTGEDQVLLRFADRVFTCIFSVEIVLRIFGEGKNFVSLINPLMKWNLFDAGILVVCVMDELADILGHGAGMIDISVLRLLRILRLARILRIVRVMRFFRDLRVMIAGILLSLKSLLWALVLLGLWMYSFSVCILDTLHIAASDNDISHVDLSAYATLPTAVITLYKSVFGGVDWGDVADPLWDVQPGLMLAYLIYIAFAVLCVLNIVTGVFVENANKITQKQEGEALMEELETRRVWLQEVQRLFALAVGKGEKKMLNREQFETLVEDMRVQFIFRKLGIEVEKNHARGLFSLLDFDGNGEVDADEFACGLDQLHGEAKSIDVVRLQHNVKKIDEKLSRLLRSVSGPPDLAFGRAAGSLPFAFSPGVGGQGFHRSMSCIG